MDKIRIKDYTKSNRMFVEDDLLANISDNEVDKIVRTHMTFKNMLKIVPTLGNLELYTLESNIRKEFNRRKEKCQSG